MARFDRCVLDRDVAMADEVLDDEFALVIAVPAVVVMPRERWLAVLPDYVTHEFAVEEQRVDADGEQAVVLSRVRMRATVLGQDRSGTFVLSDFWRLREGVWRIWRRHSTPLSAGRVDGF